MRYRPIEERFAEKFEVDAETGCWNWTGAKVAGGYGHLSRFQSEPILAHRFSYEHHIGEIPHGKIVRHRCDNPACVNPDHLVLGDHAENMRDMDRSGRARILSAEEVRSAIEMLSSKSQYFVAKHLNVSRSTIQRAIIKAKHGDYGPDVVVSEYDKKYARLTEEQRSEAIRMLETGERITTVAKAFGVDRRTIRNLRPSHLSPLPRGRPRGK